MHSVLVSNGQHFAGRRSLYALHHNNLLIWGSAMSRAAAVVYTACKPACIVFCNGQHFAGLQSLYTLYSYNHLIQGTATGWGSSCVLYSLQACMHGVLQTSPICWSAKPVYVVQLQSAHLRYSYKLGQQLWIIQLASLHAWWLTNVSTLQSLYALYHYTVIWDAATSWGRSYGRCSLQTCDNVCMNVCMVRS